MKSQLNQFTLRDYSGNVLTLNFVYETATYKTRGPRTAGRKSLSIWSCEYQQEVTMVLKIEVRYVNM